MKKILSEDRIDYQNYRFGYCVNIILEEDDSIEKAFERGYLPYTGNAKNTEERDLDNREKSSKLKHTRNVRKLAQINIRDGKSHDQNLILSK